MNPCAYFARTKKEAQPDIIENFPVLMDEIIVFAFIAYSDGTVCVEKSKYLHNHYNRHYPPDIIKKIIKYLHTISREGEVFLYNKLIKVKEKYRNDYELLLFFMLEAYALIKADSNVTPKELATVDKLAELFDVTLADMAVIQHLFSIQEASPELHIQSSLDVLVVSSCIENAELYYPDVDVDFYIVSTGTNYYIINRESAYDIFLSGFPVNSYAVARITENDAISFGHHLIAHAAIGLLFKSKLLSVSMRLFFNPLEDTLTVSDVEDGQTVACLHSEKNLHRLMLKSKNYAVTVNGRPVAGNETYLQVADTLQIGHFSKFRLLDFLEERRFQKTIALSDQEAAYTISTDGHPSPTRVLLKAPTDEPVTLTIQKENAEYVLFCVCGCQEIRVNDHLVMCPYTLVDGDIISVLNNFIILNLCRNELVHYIPTFLSFIADNLSYKFPGGNTAINKVSFKIKAGTLVAIMGPSGCGKSTILNLLNGALIPTSGTVLINGHDLHQNYNSIRGAISYSPQDDLLFSNLSVAENLIYSACIRKPDVSRSHLERKSTSVLTDIDLLKKKDEKVGDIVKKNLSGGQRKRVNIGIELMNDPEILFLDEPTSGLSSLDSEQIIQVLKKIAQAGKIVFVVIHQPSSAIFKLFDQLILLDNGGELVFSGYPGEAIAHFRNHSKKNGDVECPSCGNMSPEEIFEIMEEKILDRDGKPVEVMEQGKKIQIRKFWPAYWRHHFKYYAPHHPVIDPLTEEQSAIPAPQQHSVKNRLKQTFYIFLRNFVNVTRDKSNLLITLIAAPLLALFISFVLYKIPNDSKGYIYSDNPNMGTFLFLMVIVSIFFGLTCSADQIIKDRKILIREKMLDTGMLSYYLSKLFTLLIFALIQNVLFIVASSIILGNWSQFTIYLPFCFASSFAGITLGLFLSSFNITTTAAFNIVPLILIPQIILGGAILKFEDMNKRLLFFPSRLAGPASTASTDRSNLIPEIIYLMPSYYAFEGLMVYSNNHNLYEKYMNSYENTLRYWNKMADEHQISEAEITRKISQLESDMDAFRKDHPISDYLNKSISDAVKDGKTRFNKRLEELRQQEKEPLFVSTFLSPEKIVFKTILPTPCVNITLLLMAGCLFALLTLYRLRKI